MPRQSRGPSSSAPKRPAPAPAARPMPQQPPQARQASTVARPPMQAQQQPPPAAAPAQQSSSGGTSLFGQMASTAAGVAVGSSIGHAIGGFFGGGPSQTAPATAEPSQPVAQTSEGQYTVNANYQAPMRCEQDVNNFRQCMDQNRGDLTICGWYLDQLKACQAQASQY